MRPIREMLDLMVRRGIERGELREDLDVEAVVDILHAAPIYRLLMSGGAMESVSAVPELIAPVLLEGISSSSAGRASARPRS